MARPATDFLDELAGISDAALVERTGLSVTEVKFVRAVARVWPCAAARVFGAGEVAPGQREPAELPRMDALARRAWEHASRTWVPATAAGAELASPDDDAPGDVELSDAAGLPVGETRAMLDELGLDFIEDAPGGEEP